MVDVQSDSSSSVYDGLDGEEAPTVTAFNPEANLLSVIQEHDLDEEGLAREMDEGFARQETAKNHFAKRLLVQDNIKAKLREQLDFKTAGVTASTSMWDVASNRSPAPSEHDSATGSLEGFWTGESRRHAHNVSFQLSQRQQKVTQFSRRRFDVQQEERRARASLSSRLKAADDRVVVRQEEIALKQQLKTAVAQAKRNQQQKVAREIARDQERSVEAYYAKFYKKKQDPNAGEWSAAPPRGSDSAFQSMPSLHLGGDQDVMHYIQESHSVYTGVIERWQSLVDANDGRARAHWHKMFRDSDYEHLGPVPVKKKTVKDTASRQFHGERGSSKDDLSSIREKDISRKSSHASIGSPATTTELAEDSRDAPGTVQFSFSEADTTLGGPSTSDLLGTSRSNLDKSSRMAKWESQRELVRQHQQDNEALRLEQKRQADESLAQARQRIEAATKTRVNKALETNQTWQEKNDRFAANRASNGVKDREAAERRFQECLARQAERKREKEEALSEDLRKKQEDAFEARMNLERNRLAYKESLRKHMAAKEHNSLHNLRAIWLDTDRHVQDKREKFEERQRQIGEHRDKMNKEMRKHAQEEIARRAARMEKLDAIKTVPILQACREKRRATLRENSLFQEVQMAIGAFSPSPLHSSVSSGLSPAHESTQGQNDSETGTQSPASPKQKDKPPDVPDRNSSQFRLSIDVSAMLIPQPSSMPNLTSMAEEDETSDVALSAEVVSKRMLGGRSSMLEQERFLEELQSATTTLEKRASSIARRRSAGEGRQPRKVSILEGSGTMEGLASGEDEASDEEGGSESSVPLSDDGSEGGFLEELKTRSAAWLADLRPKA